MRQLVFLVLLTACAAPRPAPEPAPVDDAIVVCGERFRTGAHVVRWDEAGGYDGYRDAHFGRRRGLQGDTPAEVRNVVRQVVVHYDVCGTSCRCFDVLNRRGLSCHFLVDVDGTIYQTLDVKERAWHAAEANDRSVGIEIAQIGAYRNLKGVLAKWYGTDAQGARLTIPSSIERGRLPPDLDARPSRPGPIRGPIHGTPLVQYDYTSAQYRALGALLASLNRALPAIRLEIPRGPDGCVVPTVVPDALDFYGVLGHYHLTKGKIDPGPAFDWDLVLGLARARTEGGR